MRVLAFMRRLRTDKDLQEWLILGAGFLAIAAFCQVGWLSRGGAA